MLSSSEEGSGGVVSVTWQVNEGVLTWWVLLYGPPTAVPSSVTIIIACLCPSHLLFVIPIVCHRHHFFSKHKVIVS
jgi:hypothetical protein